MDFGSQKEEGRNIRAYYIGSLPKHYYYYTRIGRAGTETKEGDVQGGEEDKSKRSQTHYVAEKKERKADNRGKVKKRAPPNSARREASSVTVPCSSRGICLKRLSLPKKREGEGKEEWRVRGGVFAIP